MGTSSDGGAGKSKGVLAYNITYFLASGFAFAMVQHTPHYSDRDWLLMTLAFVLFLYITVIKAAVVKVSLLDDGEIDWNESVYVEVADVIRLILMLMLPQFFFRSILNRAVDEWPLPEWYLALAIAAVLVVTVVLALSLYYRKTQSSWVAVASVAGTETAAQGMAVENDAIMGILSY
jgi:hypothetical protein